jgi:hypothetical protein
MLKLRATFEEFERQEVVDFYQTSLKFRVASYDNSGWSFSKILTGFFGELSMGLFNDNTQKPCVPKRGRIK